MEGVKLNTSIKPACAIWVQPKAAMKMPSGHVPNSWYIEKPGNTSTEYMQVIVPYDYFEILWAEKLKLDEATSDLPFN